MDDTVDMWLVRTRLPADTVATLAEVLDDDERDRAAEMSDDGNRRRFVVAHAALRLIVAPWLDIPAGAVRWHRGPHGKPELAGATGAQVSLSHSGEFAAVAVTGTRRVGVDLQELAAGMDRTGAAVRMASRWYPPAEARFVADAADPTERADRFARLWARKEACVKVAGGQLVPGLRLAVRGPSPVLTGDGADRYLVRDLDAPPGFAAAVALEGADDYRVVQRWWSAPEPEVPPVPDMLAVQKC